MTKDGMRSITIRLQATEYREWQLFIKEKYGIEPAGRYSEIVNKNTEVFIKGIRQEMDKK